MRKSSAHSSLAQPKKPPDIRQTVLLGAHLGKSGKIRRAGRIVDCPLGRGLRRIDFGRGAKLAMPIPWGDVASAFHTTGIPDITVFTPISPLSLAIARLTNAAGPILQSPRLQTWLVKKIGKNTRGPDVSTRNANPSWVWGEAKDAHGRSQASASSR